MRVNKTLPRISSMSSLGLRCGNLLSFSVFCSGFPFLFLNLRVRVKLVLFGTRKTCITARQATKKVRGCAQSVGSVGLNVFYHSRDDLSLLCIA
jgi:hypothetical protein